VNKETITPQATCEKSHATGVCVKKYDTIVWDWNGTLLDDIATSVQTLNKMLAARALPLVTADHYRDNFGFPVRPYYEALGFDFSREEWHAISVEYVETYETLSGSLSLTAGTRETLHAIHQAGIRQYVLSALREDLLETMLQRFNIRPYFTSVCGSNNIYADGKTSRGRQMLADHPIHPSATLMIGDTIHDAEVADALGFDILLYTGGHNSLPRLHSRAPLLHHRSLLPSHLSL
jgi:phosphoglycolate phosphatase